MQLSNHCYAVTGLSHSFCFYVNAGFIIGEKETIVIDTGWNLESAKTIYHYAKAVAPKNKISTVINLESHYDHTFGNIYFIDRGAKIIAHKKTSLTKDEMDEYISSSNSRIYYKSRRENKEAYIYFSGVKPFKPDTRISKDTKLEIDNLIIDILLAPGHTDTNLIAYYEEDRVMYVADSIYAGFLPTITFGHKSLWRKWLETLEMIEKIQPKILVPGHGNVLFEEEIVYEIERHKQRVSSKIQEKE